MKAELGFLNVAGNSLHRRSCISFGRAFGHTHHLTVRLYIPVEEMIIILLNPGPPCGKGSFGWLWGESSSSHSDSSSSNGSDGNSSGSEDPPVCSLDSHRHSPVC